MAILVDELREYPDVELPFSVWCHMATDGSFDELHEFAARLGLRRAWFQRDHYDLPAHGRAAAVALGAEEVTSGELLRRMAGPRGDRARRRALTPAGVIWVGDGGPAVLRYPAGSLVVIAGPPGAGKSTLAARAVDGQRVPILDPDVVRAARGLPWGGALAAWRGELARALAAGSGAVAVTTALRHGHRLGLAKAAAGARVPAHLVLLDADADLCRAGRAAQGPAPRISDGLFEHLLREWEAFRRGLAASADPQPFDSVTVLSRATADRVR